MTWLSEHIHHPWPTKQEKKELCRLSGLSPKQLRIWFTNNRKRKLAAIAKEKQMSSPIMGSNSVTYSTDCGTPVLQGDMMTGFDMMNTTPNYPSAYDMNQAAINAQLAQSMNEMAKYCMCDLLQLSYGLNLMNNF